MGFFSKFTGKLTGVIGLGSKGAGGRTDAIGDYNRYIGQIDPIVNARREELQRQYNPFTTQIGSIAGGIGSSAYEGLSAPDMTGALEQSAVQATLGQRMLAMQAARGANARGGLAFGGGSSALATLAGNEAGVNLGASLADARARGLEYRSQYDLQRAGALDQFNLQRTGLQLGAAETQSGLMEALFNRQQELNMADLQGRYGIAGGFGQQGLQGQAGVADRRFDFLKFAASKGKAR